MEAYDPECAPDSESWLALDESDRLEVVEDAISAERGLPNRRLHATFHLIVENQAAMGDETPVAATLERLIGEGLSRHDAVHAVGSVLSTHVYRAMRLGGETLDGGDPNESYWRDLEDLTAEAWRRSR